jgi:hypothetical protein
MDIRLDREIGGIKMHHTINCLRFGKSSDCPTCRKIRELIASGYTKKQVTKMMSEENYLHDLRTIKGEIVTIRI